MRSINALYKIQSGTTKTQTVSIKNKRKNDTILDQEIRKSARIVARKLKSQNE